MLIAEAQTHNYRAKVYDSNWCYIERQAMHGVWIARSLFKAIPQTDEPLFIGDVNLKITKKLMDSVNADDTVESYKTRFKGYQERVEIDSRKRGGALIPLGQRFDWNSEVEQIVRAEIARLRTPVPAA
jgi:hypothetical protein